MNHQPLKHISILGAILSLLTLAACENHAGSSGSLRSTTDAPRRSTTSSAPTANATASTPTPATPTTNPSNPMTMKSPQDANPLVNAANLESAMFGAGCFWQVEEVFRKVPGVITTAVGYAGGKTNKPTYQEVCTGSTNHAEVLHIEFDPKVVSYDQLLDVFWKNHNPTTLNRQGPDVGTQYRSAIFYYSPEQKKAAEESKKRLDTSKKWKKPVVTQIEPAPEFYRAEDYHQRYLQKRGIDACHIVEDDG
jgi:peptide-methionine (S)-S-oxide reductase